MATKPKTQLPATREQHFAYYLAQGFGQSEAARLAGYSPSMASGKASKMARRLKIQLLIGHYRRSFGILDGALLEQSLESLQRIINNPNATDYDTLRAATTLLQLHQNFQKNRYRPSVLILPTSPAGLVPLPPPKGTPFPTSNSHKKQKARNL